ncbi:MAG: hypothetical protein ACK4PK_11280 [Alphaproteobacteria bacterium]
MTTSAPDTAKPQNTATEKPLNPDTWMARKMLPDLDPHSPLLPTNKWIMGTLKDMVKTHKGIRVSLKRAGALALGGLAALGAGVVAAVMAPSLIVAGAVGAAAVLVSGAAGFFAKKQLEKIKNDYMNDVQEIVKNKYLEMKTNELKRAWQEKAVLAKRAREERQAAAAAKKAAEAKAAADAAAQKDAKAAADSAPAADKADAAADKKPSVLKTFGRWAALKAKEGLHAAEDKLHDALEDKKPDAPKEATPLQDNNPPSAAPRKNAAPKNGG